MREVLVLIALLTAPPLALGFEFDNSWACARYLPALDKGPLLHLRHEWTELDPHQKTVLSDDFGMGITTLLLFEALDTIYFAHTQYLVKTLNTPAFSLKPSQKKGQRKSPDFVAVDTKGRAHIIECKGTQTPSTLYKLLNNGIPQKQNMRVGPPYALGQSLVAGVYIPQHGGGKPLCQIIDPEIELAEGERNQGNGGDNLAVAAARANVASALHLLGLRREGNAVALKENEMKGPPAERVRELSTVLGIGKLQKEPFIVQSRTVFYPHELHTDNGMAFDEIRIRTGLSRNIFDAVVAGDLDRAVRQSVARTHLGWRRASTETRLQLATATGMFAELELLARG
ncbi:hypothetical protein JYK02_01015 [Corallococcus macrosporus]|uniref:Uncharacterized protein n=1 Tax=Corallococcus macrosporus TaxID=35 RepID=A0ABS3D372_9BACT|nr:hypothetical protein [Corallococcus macrosporus]MBN8226085.1 hypothetical protein [Corallococcus macrosporus]